MQPVLQTSKQQVIEEAMRVIDQTIDTYHPKGWLGINHDHQIKLANLFLNGIENQRLPMAQHLVVWLQDGKTISDFTAALTKWVELRPIRNGFWQTTSGEKVQRYRQRPRMLFQWAREVKAEDAEDNHSSSGEHFHLVLIIDRKYYRKQWLKSAMLALQEAGIVRTDDRAWKATGFHVLDTPQRIGNAFQHCSYICKLDQKTPTIREKKSRTIGRSQRLRPLYARRALQ